jgi:hypothetical protein
METAMNAKAPPTLAGLSDEISAMPPFANAATIIRMAKKVVDEANAHPGYEAMSEHARLISLYFQVVENPGPNDYFVASYTIRCAQKILSDVASKTAWLRQNAPASTTAN